jgi:2-polyprenyl-3-methyl-5-hydroxy-6-metoxy-1,4-benzoquinol methylase
MISNDDLNDYNSNYWKDVQSNDKESRKFYYAQAISRIKYLDEHLRDTSKLKILDIGAGQGFIFDLLKLKNNDVSYSVVEIDKNIHNELHQKGIRNIYSSWKEIKNYKFDLIILSHVIEHFREPVLYLREIKKLLKKRGCIFVEVPNRDDTHKLCLESHLLVFNEKSLRRLIKEIGMQIIDFRSVGRNIDILKKSSILIYFKKILKKHFPILITIKRLIKQRIAIGNNINKGRVDLNNLLIKYKLNEYNNNGQWFRLIIKN